MRDNESGFQHPEYPHTHHVHVSWEDPAAEPPPDMSEFKMTEIREGAPPKPAPNISDYEMETIRDPGNSGLPFILVMVVALIIIMLLVMK